MTLEDLVVKIRYQLDTSGLDRARRGTKELQDDVDETSQSIEGLQKALNVLTGVAVAGATAGTYAYQRWSRSMVELSGKAGLTLKQFKELTKTSAQISSHTGLGESFIREMQQRAYSLGADRRTASRLAHMASVLHVTRQAIGTDAVEAAMALQGSNLGRAIPNLQMVHAASQVGGGNVPDYFSAATTLAASAGPAGVNIQDLLAMLTIGSRGGSLSGAAAGIDQFLLALNRPPQKKPGDLYKKQTGQDWSNMDSILREEGMVALIRHISENFKQEDIFKLFGEKEAIKTVALLAGAVDDLAENRDSIATAVERDTIGSFDRDTYAEFSRKFDRFTSTLGRFMEAYGEPFAKFIGLFLDAASGFVNGLIELNKMLGGLLAWLPFLITGGLIAGKMSLPGLLLALGAARAGWLGSKDGKSRLDSMREFGNAGNTKQGTLKPGTLAATGAGAAAGGGIFVWFARWVTRGITRVVDYLRAFISDDPSKFTKEWGQKGDSLVNKSLRFSATFILGAILRKMGAVVLWLGIIAGALGLLSKFRKWDATEELNAARRSDTQADYFRAQGLSGGEPAPGIADIAASQRAFAEAQEDVLWAQLMDVARARINAIREWLPDIVVSWFDAIGGVMQWYLETWDWIFGRLGMFIREFFADPRAALSYAWDTIKGKKAEADASMLEALLEVLGEEPSEESKALGKIVDSQGDGTIAQPALRLPKGVAEALGITGGDYGNVWDSGNVNYIMLPTPPVPLNQSSVSNAPQVNLTINEINMGATADEGFQSREEVEEFFKNQLRHQADYIIQEMDALSP